MRQGQSMVLARNQQHIRRSLARIAKGQRLLADKSLQTFQVADEFALQQILNNQHHLR